MRSFSYDRLHRRNGDRFILARLCVRVQAVDALKRLVVRHSDRGFLGVDSQ